MKFKMDRRAKVLALAVVFAVVFAVIIAGFISYAVVKLNDNKAENNVIYGTESPIKNEDDARTVINNYAEKHGLSMADYPQSLIELLARNNETKDFVLSYPEEKDKKHRINLNEYKNCKSVPLFM